MQTAHIVSRMERQHKPSPLVSLEELASLAQNPPAQRVLERALENVRPFVPGEVRSLIDLILDLHAMQQAGWQEVQG